MSSQLQPIKVLISPLDWGLGHATRLIPIIKYLQGKAIIHIAASGYGLEVLKKNFENDKAIIYHNLQNLLINYGDNSKNVVRHLALQLPALLKKKKIDERAVKALHKEHQFQLIISDNRYGIAAPGAYNIFMTHQLQILSGINNFFDKSLFNIHKRLYNSYQELWVVDHPKKQHAIVPALSYPKRKSHRNVQYIGHLSQFNNSTADPTIKKNNKILILLSGPEPARSQLLDNLLLQASALTNYQFVFITGSPNDPFKQYPSHMSVHGLMPMMDIKTVFNMAELVICRSGYSTVMDLMAFNQKALLIPTPGQTEQEYIGQELLTKDIMYVQSQADLNLDTDIPRALSYKGFDKNISHSINAYFQSRLEMVLRTIQASQF